MAKLYDADEQETLDAMNTTWGGDVEAYKQDNVRRCEICLVLWDTREDSTGVKRTETGFVCEGECEEEYEEISAEDARADESTLYARGGSVVG